MAIILIARLLGPDLYGIYTLAFVIPGLLQLFVGLGVNTSVIRYSAYYVSVGRPEEAKRFTLNGISFVVILGVVLTAASALLAGPSPAPFWEGPRSRRTFGLLPSTS